MTGSVLLLAAGIAMSGPSGGPAAKRLRTLAVAGRAPRVRLGAVARPGAALLAGLGMGMSVGGGGGLVIGVLAAAAVHRLLGRLESAAHRASREQRAAALPVALDLLAICLRAGNPLVLAVETVADALPGPLAADLTAAARLQWLGADPVVAWAEHEQDPVLAPVVRLIRRSAGSGSRLAAAFERLADERRAAETTAGERRAGRAAVLATIPLGLCYLPAFVCLGVIPLALSLMDVATG